MDYCGTMRLNSCLKVISAEAHLVHKRGKQMLPHHYVAHRNLTFCVGSSLLLIHCPVSKQHSPFCPLRNQSQICLHHT